MNPSLLDEQAMEKLWVWFETQYGAAFTTQYGDKAPQWMAALNRAKISRGNVAHACAVLESRGDRMPPNLNEFRWLCKTAKKATAAHRPFRAEALPAPKDPQAHARAMEQIKRVVKATRVPPTKPMNYDFPDFLRMYRLMRERLVEPDLIKRMRAAGYVGF